MKNKFLGIIGLITIIVFVGIGCGSSKDDDNGSSIGALQSVKNKGIKSLYSSNISIKNSSAANANSVNASAALSATDIKTLSYIEAGQNTPVVFITSDDKEVVLEISIVN